MLARLYAAVGKCELAVGCVANALGYLPAYAPPKGFLFDIEMVLELISRGCLHSSLLDYVNRIEDPTFLLYSITRDELRALQQDLASRIGGR
jgi:hypothetical protein